MSYFSEVIREAKNKLENEILEKQNQLKELQEHCLHYNALSFTKSNEFIRDPLEMLEKWTEYFCQDCGYEWREDGN